MSIHLTPPDAERYLWESRLHWLTPEQVLANPHLRNQAKNHKYAGVNPMAHHYSTVSRPGFAGFAQMIYNITSATSAKYDAGDWLVTARKRRAEGNRRAALACIDRAGKCRRRAATLLRDAMETSEYRMAAE